MKWIAMALVPTLVGTGLFCTQTSPVQLLSEVKPKQPRPHDQTRSHKRLIFAGGIVEGAAREVPLEFELAGRLTELRVWEGALVKQGDVLARLDDTLLRHELAEADANLSVARAERERLVNGSRIETRRAARSRIEVAQVLLEHADRDLKRSQLLSQRNAISSAEIDDHEFAQRAAAARLASVLAEVAEIEAPAREDELRRAEARIKLAEAVVSQAQERLAKTMLSAPTDGVILRISAEPGELLGTDRSQTFLAMTNISQIRVRAYVEELDALTLEIGQSTYVTVDGRPDEQYRGEIVWLAPGMGPKRHRHHKPNEHMDQKVREVLIQLERSEGLIVGVPVDVFIKPVKAKSPE
ncbi:MAG: hypothetical protein CMJ48_14160 [Planctomycetaceae bacterium]|nr:hypothetical protein [Planctomycetaceae bacterium]